MATLLIQLTITWITMLAILRTYNNESHGINNLNSQLYPKQVQTTSMATAIAILRIYINEVVFSTTTQAGPISSDRKTMEFIITIQVTN